MKTVLSNIAYSLAAVGIADMIVQGITRGEVKIVRTVFAAIFG